LIAADSSSFIRFLRNAGTPDSKRVRDAIKAQDLWLPPPVKTEVLSGGPGGPAVDQFVQAARLLPILDGFWIRVGLNRRILLSKGLKARLADTLIAQCCMDSDVALITGDSDFRHFERWCGLKLAI
jgi:predicted nucleic acid-binding protein